MFPSNINLTSTTFVRYESLRKEWDKAVENIRKVPGLETYLLPPSFDHVQQAAEHGPIVIVNVTKRRSDALIVLHKGDPILVPLPEAKPEDVQTLASCLEKQPGNLATVTVLRRIWTIIVAPVVQSLRTAPIQLSHMARIWWCPVGAASGLPLHAAGRYTQDDDTTLSRTLVSSYTPTLGALIRARQIKRPSAGDQVPSKTMLVVGLANTPQEKPLPSVPAEIQAIRAWVPNTVILEESAATKAAVLDGIHKHPWLHLACHGHHNPEHPFRSHFSMHDGPLSLLDLSMMALPHAELAVLSACHSARGSEALPDESLHLAAGMIFAGFKSVIGTLWALDDSVGSALANEFHRIMSEGMKDCSDAAASLNQACIDGRTKNPKTDWLMGKVTVVHYGV